MKNPLSFLQTLSKKGFLWLFAHLKNSLRKPLSALLTMFVLIGLIISLISTRHYYESISYGIRVTLYTIGGIFLIFVLKSIIWPPHITAWVKIGKKVIFIVLFGFFKPKPKGLNLDTNSAKDPLLKQRITRHYILVAYFWFLFAHATGSAIYSYREKINLTAIMFSRISWLGDASRDYLALTANIWIYMTPFAAATAVWLIIKKVNTKEVIQN
ncbi:MAG TPA: hypothetical protein VGE63_00950 [Candidatus Paceibacterota bacterium]